MATGAKNPYTQNNSSATKDAKKSDELVKQKVVVAMSGGVDSSVAAALLKTQGYEVIGVALQTTDYSKYRGDDSGGTCCSIKDMEDARRVAEKLDIPFYVLDNEQTFDSNVVDYFVGEYLSGRTPNPCVMCNTKVKFNHLYKKAMDMGADFIATGHYAKISKEPDLGYCLWRSQDEAKDQTYFLFNLTQNQLAKTLFPIGHLKKSDVRKMALEFNLPVAEKPDSQEICFVPGNSYSKFIEERVAPGLRPKGVIVTTKNTVLAEHDGIYKFTVGQRKGLGLALNMAKQMGFKDADQFRVVRIDPILNQVVLGTENDTNPFGLIAARVNWIVAPDFRKKRRLLVRTRHRAELAEADVYPGPDYSVRVHFVDEQKILTPGQAVVFYDGNLCLGGGWILDAVKVLDSDKATRVEKAPARL